jgi:hypothetical protein
VVAAAAAVVAAAAVLAVQGVKVQRLAVAIGCRAYLQATLGAHVSQGCPVPSRAAEHICRLLRETRMEVVTHDPTRENTQPLTRTQTHTHTHIHRHTHTDTHTHTLTLSLTHFRQLL